MTYTYDKQNQLVSARYSGSTTDTISYTYDTAGNILTEGHGGVITRDYTYAYNDASTSNDAWHDLLVAADGHAITYDGSGNPLTYYNGYKTFTSLTWEQGRQLASVTTGGKTTSYTYDADGIRKTKTIPINQRGLTCTYTFVTQNGKVVRQSWRTESIDFFYDESGRPFAMTYQRADDAPQTYYYVLNLQGDVVKLVDVSGAEVASYEYDAWGNVLLQSGSMASTNPLRYRGYYRDSETGFYYLQSRYYDPANRRFINADRYVNANGDLIGFNMYAYCSNNPVMFTDPSGENIWDWLKDKANDVEKWLSDTFGFAAYVEGDVATVEVDVILGAVETGHSASTLVSGDDSKPITFYAIAPAKWWDVFGYSVGVKYNDDGNGADIGVSPGQVDVSVCVDNTSVTASGGIFEAGVTVGRDVDLQQGSIGSYTSVYVRPWALALAYATAGMAIPALAPVLLPA